MKTHHSRAVGMDATCALRTPADGLSEEVKFTSSEESGSLTAPQLVPPLTIFVVVHQSGSNVLQTNAASVFSPLLTRWSYWPLQPIYMNRETRRTPFSRGLGGTRCRKCPQRPKQKSSHSRMIQDDRRIRLSPFTNALLRIGRKVVRRAFDSIQGGRSLGRPTFEKNTRPFASGYSLFLPPL